MNRNLRIIIAILAFSGVATVAIAQEMPDWEAEPVFDTVSLRAGFLPDPYIVDLLAGGPSQVPQRGCEGYINLAAPDLDLNYEAGRYPLSIYAQSNAYVTLLVYTPQGEWICESNTGNMGNALIFFENPQSGNYNIWVGARHIDNYPEATVSFSEENIDAPALRIR
ncbi:MAG: hypothetical protein LAT57_05755 [Balneolales bacterium]|nr:hypothetical protein [Balneolales bacterium]